MPKKWDNNKLNVVSNLSILATVGFLIASTLMGEWYGSTGLFILGGLIILVASGFEYFRDYKHDRASVTMFMVGTGMFFYILGGIVFAFKHLF